MANNEGLIVTDKLKRMCRKYTWSSNPLDHHFDCKKPRKFRQNISVSVTECNPKPAENKNHLSNESIYEHNYCLIY